MFLLKRKNWKSYLTPFCLIHIINSIFLLIAFFYKLSLSKLTQISNSYCKFACESHFLVTSVGKHLLIPSAYDVKTIAYFYCKSNFNYQNHNYRLFLWYKYIFQMIQFGQLTFICTSLTELGQLFFIWTVFEAWINWYHFEILILNFDFD